MVDLSIIIPSYNTKDLLIKCLNSLEPLKQETEIIVVDNGSTDGTMEQMADSKWQTANFKIIKNKENLGFAKAINQGLKEAKGEYLLLLNSDTVMENGTIEKMVKYLKSNPQVGVVGCQLRNSDGSIQASGGYLPNLLNVFFWMFFIDDLPIIKNIFPAFHVGNINFYSQKSSAYKKKHGLGWVTGAFLMTKKEVIDKVGLLDEAMFMYVEEVDWCQRIKNVGYEVVFNSESWITHEKGGSNQHEKAGILEEFQGLKYFFKKHKPFWQYPVLRMVLKIGALGRCLLFGIILQDKKAGQIYEKVFKLV